jgi:lipopolysaccharide biosynthesis glycosyltransferase
MINFLYCFDKFYLNQAKASINSLLSQVSEKIVINIICDHEQSSQEIYDTFKDHYMVDRLIIYNFESSDYDFPKLDGAHVSSATYFRILIDRFIPKDVKNIIYLDADIICMNDPIEPLKKISKDLDSQKMALAAFTEGTRNQAPILFNKLKLKNDIYFNAGVLVINYGYWLKKSIGDSLLDIMEKRHEDIIFWDQDLLNIYVDGSYIEIPKKLNYNYFEFKSLENKDIIFLHYAGKDKPWEVHNIVREFSKYYQKNYSKLELEDYHIIFKRNAKHILGFIKILLKLEFLKLEKPIAYLKLSIRALLYNGR